VVDNTREYGQNLKRHHKSSDSMRRIVSPHALYVSEAFDIDIGQY